MSASTHDDRDATPRSGVAEARLLVTTRGFRERRAWRALKSALPGSWLDGSGFRGVLLLTAEGDPLEVGERIVRCCGHAVGHVTPVLAEVKSDVDAIRSAAVEVATARVGAGQSFCFRIHRRGWTPPGHSAADLERELAEAVFDALGRRDGVRPRVDLEDPDVLVTAEVLGRRTVVGVVPRSWRRASWPAA
jgi:tRNA(Ser,Leu) C12 N-acetylase TAN1